MFYEKFLPIFTKTDRIKNIVQLKTFAGKALANEALNFAQ